VWATGTDDMDALTFGTPILLKRFTSFSKARKLPIIELHLDTMLDGLKLTMDQVRSDHCYDNEELTFSNSVHWFMHPFALWLLWKHQRYFVLSPSFQWDLWIHWWVAGIGKKRAMELITQYGTLEKVIANLDSKKYPLPESFPYEAVRELFKNPDVADPESFDVRHRPLQILSRF
jgi:flap endonuclease-1